MNAKILVGGIVIVIGIVLGTVNFLESNVEYATFAAAERTQKKVQVKGEWVKERGSSFDAENVKFSFYMRDDSNRVVKVVLDGARPNNFEIATSIVAKGRFVGDEFHASHILTKCPSKYEGDGETVRQTL